MIVNYLGGRSGMLFQLEDGHHLSVIGQCGISPREFSGLLSQIEGSELLKVPKEGMLRNAACNGFPYSLNEHDDPEALIETLLELLPFKSRGIWVDGISGFGVVVTFFSESPDHAMRQFATDAYVRLGRHLETSTYHNKLYNAYLKLQNTQEQMVQSSKMAAIGELATGMAHELRQPVTAINNFFTTIFDNLESERYEKLREHLGEYRSESPDHAMRQFATDAYVRLGRHLETSTYHNKLYNAYLKLQNTQEQMVQSSKMAAIGELATGMAHELRQPVTAINNFFTTIFDNLESERYEKLREHLGEYRERSHRNIERLSRIIDHLRTFGRQEPSQIRPTDMNALLDEIFEAFLNAKLAKHNFKIQRECPPNLPMVEIDGPRIEQVILNLISNACDALEGVPDPTITVGLSSDEEILCVEISDNGHGIPEQWIDKLLDPFFTTKAAGKGTGLGLSVSHGIVEGHNGRLLFQNRPEGGASFWIELPLRQP